MLTVCNIPCALATPNDSIRNKEDAPDEIPGQHTAPSEQDGDDDPRPCQRPHKLIVYLVFTYHIEDPVP